MKRRRTTPRATTALDAMCRKAPLMLRSALRPDMNSSAVLPLMSTPIAATMMIGEPGPRLGRLQPADRFPGDAAGHHQQHSNTPAGIKVTLIGWGRSKPGGRSSPAAAGIAVSLRADRPIRSRPKRGQNSAARRPARGSATRSPGQSPTRWRVNGSQNGHQISALRANSLRVRNREFFCCQGI
jgi:hypothetical protein